MRTYSKFLCLAGLVATSAGATDYGFIAERNSPEDDFVIGVASDSGLGGILTIPYPLEESITETARDGIRLADGSYVVYNGTFDPVLSHFEDGSWNHFQFSGWTTVNNGSYGGIASNGQFVFVTDMETAGDGAAQGVVRFDLSEQEPTVRFAEDIEPIDLTIGRDGGLYILYPGGSPSGRMIDVYNIVSLSKLATINLQDIFGFTEHRSIAVDSNGDIFIADWDGDIQRIDSSGNILHTLDLEENLYDVDLIGDEVLVGSRFGEIFILNKDFSSSASVNIEDFGNSLSDRGVFILGESVDTTFLDSLFSDRFETPQPR
ncbi:MAG: hypothetical protein U5L08_16595 [Xanthomonadales bacterium]|nr:hypothetical protein [Xanthomonadales bacterium]